MTDIQLLRKLRKLDPTSWSRQSYERALEIVRTAVVKNSSEMAKLPYFSGLYCATFPEAQIAVLPGQSAGYSHRFYCGFSYGNSITVPGEEVKILIPAVIHLLTLAGRIQPAPLPEKLLEEAKALKDAKGCVLHATAIVADTSYTTAYDFYAAGGREHRHGTQLRQILGYIRNFGRYQLQYRLPGTGGGRTLGSWLRKHPTGRHIVVIKGHAFAVVDGKPFDHTPIPKGKRIQYFYTATLNQ